ncbi:MAG TPA: hypothetical protein VHY34_06310 [Caulobacteraceae bacterium]|nr:hypothetical protein [Caulobacteraceae bacterium]
MAIEEFEDLDRDLAPVAKAVAELGGDEGPIRRVVGDVLRDRGHLGDGRA